MNADLMLEVADAIEAHPQHFDMTHYWEHGNVTGTPAECGTTGCVAGWAFSLAGERADYDLLIGDHIHETARALLDLTHVQAAVMFSDWSDDRADAHSIATRLRLIAKGELTWDDDEVDWR